jgi:hypothetical protein
MSTKQQKLEIKLLCKQLHNIKHDILYNNNPKKSDPKYHEWINRELHHIVPPNPCNNDLFKNLDNNPQQYLPCMIYMMKKIQQSNNKIYHVFPIRSQKTPMNITIDTTTIVHLKKTTGGNIKNNGTEIWAERFKIDRKIFHCRKNDNHPYTFQHMIETDGISCTILLKNKQFISQYKMKSPKQTKSDKMEPYIHNISDIERHECKQKTIVAMDPGMSDLFFAVDNTTKKSVIPGDGGQRQFRYTQNCRRHEKLHKKNRKIYQTLINKTIINERTIAEHISDLSHTNMATLDFHLFLNYCTLHLFLNY